MTENIRTNTSSPLLRKSRLVDQTSGGPTLHDAAAQLLQKALKKRFPEQDIDPDKAMLASPVWHPHGGALVTHGNHFESLTHVLARLGFTKTTANYIEGEHFLTLTSHASDPSTYRSAWMRSPACSMNTRRYCLWPSNKASWTTGMKPSAHCRAGRFCPTP
ncbi:hypothetical protein [Pseudomonas sp. ADAK2 TE3594]